MLWAGEGDDTLKGGADDDELYGEEGDDTLILGDNDVATGGSGADTFVTGSYVADGLVPHIEDFDQAEDALVVTYVPGATAPEVTVTTDPDDAKNAIVSLNGVQVSYVAGGAGMDVSSISLTAV